MELSLLLVVLIFVSLGAAVKGLTGFGFGILGTALLANVIPVQDAVTVMILPMLAVNIPLIAEAEISELKNCIQNYAYFVLTGLTGSFIGILLVDFLPVQMLSLSVGAIALTYVYFKQDFFYRPKSVFSKCFTEKWYNQSLAGSISGLVFGASNIGLLYVTYLDRINIERKTFAGLLSLVILIATLIRVSVSVSTGLYSMDLLLVSVFAALLGFIVTEASAKISNKVPERSLETLTLLLILVAGVRIISLNL